eukprot:1161097-Pelagomonas_calceolata.AAC.7
MGQRRRIWDALGGGGGVEAVELLQRSKAAGPPGVRGVLECGWGLDHGIWGAAPAAGGFPLRAAAPGQAPAALCAAVAAAAAAAAAAPSAASVLYGVSAVAAGGGGLEGAGSGGDGGGGDDDGGGSGGGGPHGADMLLVLGPWLHGLEHAAFQTQKELGLLNAGSSRKCQSSDSFQGTKQERKKGFRVQSGSLNYDDAQPDNTNSHQRRKDRKAQLMPGVLGPGKTAGNMFIMQQEMIPRESESMPKTDRHGATSESSGTPSVDAMAPVANNDLLTSSCGLKGGPTKPACAVPKWGGVPA